MKKTKKEGRLVLFNRQYKGFSLDGLVLRKGSIDILKRPSRIGNTLFYPDGRIERSEEWK